MTLDPRLLRDLRSVVGEGGVSDDPADQLAYSRDLWPKTLLWLRFGRHTVHPPQAVVWPRDRREVQAVVRRLAEAGVPVIPFGAGSGVCGGTLPLRGGVILDLKRLGRLVAVRPDEGLIDVEAGVIGQDLEDWLNHRGFTLGHFPASIFCSSVGGWIAARSAGQMSTRYGKIEDMVSEIGCVTGDGEYRRLRGRPVRGQGAGLCPLVVGSEGIYAVVTDARLRIHRAPEARRFRAFRFSRLSEGLSAVRRILQAGLRPAVVRLYDAPDSLLFRAGSVGGGEGRRRSSALWRGLKQRATRALLGRPGALNAALDTLPDAVFGGCLLVLVFEGPAGAAEAEERAVADLLADLGDDLGPAPAERWFSHRYAVSYRQSGTFAAGGFNDTMEVAAPWSRIADVYAAVRAALARKVLVLAHFSHAYHEGCSIYFTFVGRADSEDAALEVYDDTWRTALAAVVEAGGVISHHHGVGLSKAQAMEGEYGGALQITRALKRVFDPAGILNPGKLLVREVPAPPTPPPAAGAPAAALEAAVPGGVSVAGDPPVYTVSPGDAHEVAACLRVATEYRLPVVGHTSAGGGREADPGARMEVSLERLQAVREISEPSLLVHAEAGIRARALEERLNEHALTLGFALLPDLSPKLGGLLGGFGWGEGPLPHGGIHEACTGLEAVLPRGIPIRVKPAPRRAAGPDLLQALLGSEGAFGIITAAYLQVHRLPPVRRIVGAWLPRPEDGLRAVTDLLIDGLRPSLARLVVPGPAWATASLRGEAALVAVFEGEGTQVERFADLWQARLAAAGAERMDEDHPLAVREPVELPAEPRRLERVEAAGRWREVLPMLGEAAALFGDDLVCARLCDPHPEGGTVAWTAFAPSPRAGARRPAFRLLEALPSRELVFRAYRGPAVLPARIARAALGADRVHLEALKRELDPAGICNPGALGI